MPVQTAKERREYQKRLDVHLEQSGRTIGGELYTDAEMLAMPSVSEALRQAQSVNLETALEAEQVQAKRPRILSLDSLLVDPTSPSCPSASSTSIPCHDVHSSAAILAQDSIGNLRTGVRQAIRDKSAASSDLIQPAQFEHKDRRNVHKLYESDLVTVSAAGKARKQSQSIKKPTLFPPVFAGEVSGDMSTVATDANAEVKRSRSPSRSAHSAKASSKAPVVPTVRKLDMQGPISEKKIRSSLRDVGVGKAAPSAPNSENAGQAGTGSPPVDAQQAGPVGAASASPNAEVFQDVREGDSEDDGEFDLEQLKRMLDDTNARLDTKFDALDTKVSEVRKEFSHLVISTASKTEKRIVETEIRVAEIGTIAEECQRRTVAQEQQIESLQAETKFLRDSLREAQVAPPVPISKTINENEFYRQVDNCILRVSAHGGVAVTVASVKATLRSHATSLNIDEERLIFESDGDDVASNIIMRFAGTPKQASKDAAAYFSSLKLGKGRWKEINARTVEGDSVRIYVSPDKNPFHQKLLFDARRLATAISNLMPANSKLKVYAKENGVVEAGFQPLAKVMPRATDGPRLSKISVFRKAAEVHGMSKERITEEYAKQRKERTQVMEAEWSDAESDEDGEREAAKGF